MQQLQLYMSRTNFPVTKDVTKMMQPIKGCKPDEKDVDVFAGGGLSNPKPVVPEAGLLLVFNTVGGVPEPDTSVPGGDVVVGVGVGVGIVVVGGVGVGVVVVVVGVGVDDDDNGKMHEPVLGLVLTIMAVPPKSQLVGAGFFW